MFSAERLSEEYAFSPKNGPVPLPPVNSYDSTRYTRSVPGNAILNDELLSLPSLAAILQIACEAGLRAELRPPFSPISKRISFPRLVDR